MSADRLELKHAGEQSTMTVASCGLVPVGKYPEYAIVGYDLQRQKDVEVRMPQSSFDRQIARIQKTAQSVVGCTITIKRDPNPNDSSKAYWGLYLESDAGVAPPKRAAQPAQPFDQPPPAPRQAAQHAPQPTNGPFLGSPIYQSITAWVLTEIQPMYEAAGLTFTAENAAAISAVLFIQAHK